MPPIDAARGASGVGANEFQQFSELEQANLLSALIRVMPSSSTLPSQTIRQMLTDPVQLSQLIKHAHIQAELATSQDEPARNLTTALARVAPRHLENLLSTLERNVRPAVNLDDSYGAPVAFAATRYGDGRPQMRGASPLAQGATLVLDAVPYPDAGEPWREPAPDWENAAAGAFYAETRQLNVPVWSLSALALFVVMTALSLIYLL